MKYLSNLKDTFHEKDTLKHVISMKQTKEFNLALTPSK